MVHHFPSDSPSPSPSSAAAQSSHNRTHTESESAWDWPSDGPDTNAPRKSPKNSNKGRAVPPVHLNVTWERSVDPRKGEPSESDEEWTGWAASHMDELWGARIDAEKKMVMSHVRDANIITDLKARLYSSETSREELRNGQKDYAERIRAMQQRCDKDIEDMKSKLSNLEQRERRLSEDKAELKKRQIQCKDYGDFCSAIQSLGEKIEKASTDMRVLVAGRARPGQTLDKWEKTNCKLEMRLVEFTSRVEKERERLRLEHVTEMKNVADLEKQAKENVTSLAKQGEELAADRMAFTLEQEQCRKKRTDAFKGAELETIIHIRATNELRRIKNELRDEAYVHCYTSFRQGFEDQKASFVAKGHVDGYEEGNKKGYDDGHMEGKASGYEQGYSEGHTAGTADSDQQDCGHRDDCTFEVGHEEGFDEGYTEGNSSGYQKGYDEGYADSMEDSDQQGCGHSDDCTFKVGYEQGHKDGYSKGYEEFKHHGYENGWSHGWDCAFESGKKRGRIEGYEAGYSQAEMKAN